MVLNMKIAFFTDTFLPQINGVTKTLARLIDYLDEKGIEHLVLAPDHQEDDFFGYNVERFLSFKFFLYPECRLSIPNFFRINKKLRDFNPDLIHIVTEFNMGLTGLQYAKLNDIPVVSSYHTNFSTYLKYYNLEFLDNLSWNYMKWFHNQCETNFCPSHETKKMLEHKGIDNVEIWTRGIDCEQFSPDYRNADFRRVHSIDNKIVLLYVGRVSMEKDLDILLNSFCDISKKYKDNVALVITGEGPMLENFRNDCPGNVIFTGYKHGDELSEIYASSDIFVFPSTTETFGNVVLEAMASGLPVIGAASGGVKDNLINGYNGSSCEPRDTDAFTKATIKLIDNKLLRVAMGYNARQHALQKSWGKVFDKLISDYERCLRKQPKGDNLEISA